MARYIITGNKKLSGEVKISGNKNSVLPCLAASLLTDQEITLTNCPDISDVDILLEILKSLGVKSLKKGDTIKLKRGNLNTHKLPGELTSKLRASILLAGPLLSILKKVEFSHPGGDVIGKRSIETHLLGFEKLGFNFKRSDRTYLGSQDSTPVSEIFLEEPSVTATENLILATVLGNFDLTLKNCAQEPHVVDLCLLLNQMGAFISGAGTSTLHIQGVPKLNGGEFRISPEYIEIGTYAIASAITGGEIKLTNCDLKDLEPITNPLKKMGIILEETNDGVIVKANQIYAIPKLTVRPWPGFPTDLMSVFIILATQAKGVSLMHDWMFESRMFFVDKLISMGASIVIADPHRVIISGPTLLVGRELETPDIRAGMALVLASLIAKGKSVINRAELIERGYENPVLKLKSLGADIERID